MSVRRRVYDSRNQEKFTNAFDDQNFKEMSKYISSININAIFFDCIGRSWGRTYLVEALNDKKQELVEFLIKNGADPNIRCNGKSPLFYAIAKEMPKMVKLLLDHKVDMANVDPEGTNSLVLALRKNPRQDEIVKIILRFGAKSRDPAQAVYYKFCGSLLQNDFRSAKTLIEQNKDMDFTSFLEFSISENCMSMVKFLLDKGVNLNGSILNAAIQTKNLDLVDLLIRSKVDVNCTKSGMTSLHHAYSVCDNYEDPAMMEMILKAGAKVDSLVFHDACAQGRFKVVRLLTKYSPGNIDFFEKETGQTLLHKAVRYPEIVRFLAQSGAVVDAVDLEKETPLHKACRQGQFLSVQVLAEHRADLSLADRDGKTILHHFANGDEDNFAWILHNTLDRRILRVDEKDREGNTALHFAGPKCLNFFELMKRDADLNSRNFVEKCPIHFHVGVGECQVWEFEEKMRTLNFEALKFTTCFFRNRGSARVDFYRFELEKLRRQVIMEKPTKTLYDMLFLEVGTSEELERLYNECRRDFQTIYPHYGWLLNKYYRRMERRMRQLNWMKKLF